MVRVRDLEKSVAFFRDALGLIENRRKDYPEGRYTLVFLAAPENPEVEVELTYNYDDEDYGGARNFGHLAFEVDDIYACLLYTSSMRTVALALSCIFSVA